MEKITRFLKDESGAASQEHTYWVTVIAMLTFSGISLLGIHLQAEWAVGPQEFLRDSQI
jgi:Flp pilus assembly pilin Flp